MRNVKKLTAVTLAAAMAASLAGCGGDANSQSASGGKGAASTASGADADTASAVSESADTEDGYTVRKDENGNVYDLGGMEIVIRDWWTSDEETEPSNAYEEARAEYLDWIQETYNFTIRQAAISTWDSAPEDFVNYATTGGDENYIFVLRQGGELVSAMNSGLMYDLSTLDCLDFSKDKWKSGIHELMTKNDAVYGMRGIDPEPRAGIFFNKRLLEEAGVDPESIYELQENMEWTWDKFEELCKQVQADTDNDGVIDRYAMTNFSSTLYPAAVHSNGGQFIGRDDNGYYSDLESEETMEGLNWALDMIDKYEMKYPEDAEWDYTYTAFQNGEAVFSCAEAYCAGDWAQMEDDFGFVCFPMGPKSDDYANCYNDNVYVIPACYDAEKAWNLAFAYDLFTDPVPGYEDYAAWKSDYYNNFRDTESVDLTLARMMDNGMIDYTTMIPNLDLGEDLMWGISKESTPAQQAEKIRNTWASYLTEANK